MDELVVEKPRDNVALVRIDHPPANALTYALRLRIRDAWRELRDDDAVRAIVVTGTGDRFFCAGLDLEEVVSWRDDTPTMHERIDLLRWAPDDVDLWKPIVGAINGYCLAGGWYLAEMCDLRLAVERAEFGIPEGRWGLPAVFAPHLLSSLPLNIALEATLLSDRRIPATRMLELGWLNGIVSPTALLDVALDWATEVAALPPAAVAAHKKLLRAPKPDDMELRAWAERTVRPLYDEPAVTEGINAFLDSRRQERK